MLVVQLTMAVFGIIQATQCQLSSSGELIAWLSVFDQGMKGNTIEKRPYLEIHCISCCTSLFHSNPSQVQSKVKVFCKLIWFFLTAGLSFPFCSRLRPTAVIGRRSLLQPDAACAALCEKFYLYFTP